MRSIVGYSVRPWGDFVQYTENEPTTVKIIHVKPGEKLSVQRHEHRDEQWVALDPGLIATIGDEEFHLNHGTIIDQPPHGEKTTTYPSAWIPRGTIHSMRNAGKEPARFLEIAFGHFDEDDIERLEDKYGRA